MKGTAGFREAKAKVLKALAEGTYLHEQRGEIDVKNWRPAE